MMDRKIAFGATVAIMLLAISLTAVFMTDWEDENMKESPQEIEVFDSVTIDPVTGDAVINEDSLNYTLFEKYGPVLLILAVTMFGAMVGAVCIAREEEDHNDSY